MRIEAFAQQYRDKEAKPVNLREDSKRKALEEK